MEHPHASLALLRLWPGARVLDVNRGSAADAAQLASRVGAIGLVATVDANLDGLAQIRARRDGSFDAARADQALHAQAQPTAALGELVRVVRPGGRVVVCEPDLDTWVLETSEPALTARLLEYQRSQNAMPGRRLRRFLDDAGLRETEVVAHAQIATDLAVADRMLGLSDLLQAAIASGALSGIEAIHWRVALGRDSANKRFLAAVTVFTAGGTRPYSSEAKSGSSF